MGEDQLIFLWGSMGVPLFNGDRLAWRSSGHVRGDEKSWY